MQRDFEIFTRSTADSIAVKRGFSWPGFFFTWIWAFIAGLWLEGVLILLAGIVIPLLRHDLSVRHALVAGLASCFINIFVGMRGNFWRSRKLERAGYAYEGLISARSKKEALTAFRTGNKSGAGGSGGGLVFFSAPKWCQKVLAIAGLTWKAALRFKLFLVIAALLILAVVGLPVVIRDDGTAQGFTQIILTYTLSAITALLGISTLWLSCGTLARDIEECQIQVVATKPIARWQIWLGKWLGIVTLNAALLAISGGCVFGLLQWRAAKLPAEEQKVLREQILVARGSAKEPSSEADIDKVTAKILEDRLKTTQVEKVDVREVAKNIREGVKANFQVVPPSYTRQWKINLGLAKTYLAGKPLQLRVKFNPAVPGAKTASGTLKLLWQVGNPESGKYWPSEPMSLSPDTYHEFAIPPDLFDKDGTLQITVLNPDINNMAVLFPLEDGMEVLYPEGGFALNFARGLGIIFCWLALMAALGLMAASFLSFPVAAFFSLAMLVMVMSSGTLADAIDSGSVAAGDEEKGIAGHSPADIVLIPAFKALLSVIRLVGNFSPIDSLSTGRSITWLELGTAFTQIVLVIGGIFAVLGIVFFNRRELATAQGTQ